MVALVVLAFVAYRGVSAEGVHAVAGLAFFGAVSTFLFLCVEVTARAANAKRETLANVRVLLITLTLMLLAVELFSRYYLRSHQTYQERNGQGFYSLYTQGAPTWFHTYLPNTRLVIQKAEFTHERTINSLGLPGHEISGDPERREIRIIALGDSFTEGIGTTQDSTWVSVMERSVAARLPDMTVRAMNAGIAGSDVWFEYTLLNERLLHLQPDMVIVAVNNTDVHDLHMRGGQERFRPNGSFVPSKTAPRWEWAYGLSYVFRHVIHDVLRYDSWLMKADDVAQEQDQARASLRQALDAFVELSRIHDFKLLIALHPENFAEIVSGEYDPSFAPLVADLKGDSTLPLFDVLDCFTWHGPVAPEVVQTWFWGRDAHHTTTGYEVLGTAIANTPPVRAFVERHSRDRQLSSIGPPFESASNGACFDAAFVDTALRARP